jgi:hypothetical protein
MVCGVALDLLFVEVDESPAVSHRPYVGISEREVARKRIIGRQEAKRA